jgi:Domain of unknown function (DUF397)
MIDVNRAEWRTSTRSGGTGGDCVEVAARWRKSTRSGGTGGNCVEVADGLDGVVAVRDSKDRGGPVLVFASDAWAAFVAGARNGLFDR